MNAANQSVMIINKKKRFTRRHLFIILMLIYPVAHFAIMWGFVNINGILMSFQTYVNRPSARFPEIGWNWVGLHNYETLWNNILNDRATQILISNSLSYAVLNILVITPLAVLASYFMFKKVLGVKFFRIVFFLPSIMPIAILALAFLMALDPIFGSVTALLKMVGISNPPVWFGGEPMAQYSIWIFCVWAGLGYNVILLGSAINRIPKDIIEYGKLEGISYTRELFQIVVPLVWPTFTTIVIMALMAPFVVFVQPMFLTAGEHNTRTIAQRIFEVSQGSKTGLQDAAALGLFVSLIGAPIIVAVRMLMERCFRGVDF